MTQHELTTRPDDFSFRYDWAEGSLPPPHHYSYAIRVAPDGQGVFEMMPDYPFNSPPLWSDEFVVPLADLDRLFQRMLQEEVFSDEWIAAAPHSVGGARDWLQVAVRGRTYDVPQHVSHAVAPQATFAAIRAMVPASLREDMHARREQYVREHLPVEPDTHGTYTVFVDDNYNSMDESARYRLGEFATLDAAIAAAQKIVDACLLKAFRPGLGADELLRGYRAYGEDPYIVPSQAQDGKVLFSAWQYAQTRCAELCGPPSTKGETREG